MKIFKKKTDQTSNDYEVYKAELSGSVKVEENSLFTDFQYFRPKKTQESKKVIHIEATN